MEHCTQLKFEHPDKIAPGVTEWIEGNPIIDRINAVSQMTVAEPVSGLSQPNGQPQAKYVFNFYIFWTSKPIPDDKQ